MVPPTVIPDSRTSLRPSNHGQSSPIGQPSPIDADPLAVRTRAIWEAADFGRIAAGYSQGAAEFVARLDIEPGARVLDIACGTGNLALPAARAGATVTGIDIAPNLVRSARANALAEGLAIRFDEGNAEALPYADNEFDVAITMFGAMFAARPERTAAEMLRVVRPGGRIAMANWLPGGFVGQMLRAHAELLPPPNTPSPIKWGEESIVRSRLGRGASWITMTPRPITFTFAMSPAAVVELFRAHYGPTVHAFGTLGSDARAALHENLVRLWTDWNIATDGTTRVEAEYLDVRVGVA